MDFRNLLNTGSKESISFSSNSAIPKKKKTPESGLYKFDRAVLTPRDSNHAFTFSQTFFGAHKAKG